MSTRMSVAASGRGFTLVELLVVVAIVVVLLALLMPALDRAVYEAELAVCGSQNRNIASGVIGYAMDKRRSYPDRGGVTNPPPSPLGSQPVDVAFSIGATTYFDDRSKLRGYVSMGRSGHLMCPLTGRIDVEAAHSNSWTMSPYALYFGWSFMDVDDNARQLPGMNRIGDRLTWVERIGNRRTTYRFNVLACDDDLFTTDNGFGTHPNEAGVWENHVYQNAGIDGYKLTLSRWQGPSNPPRGPVDLNFGLDDGSVIRIVKVGRDRYSGDSRPAEGKVVPVPYITRTVNMQFYRHLPAQY